VLEPKPSARYDFYRVAQSVKPADVGVTVGQVFQAKYRVDSIIGHGGMGVVAECTHLALNERVAIKMLRQDVLSDNDAVQRFIREAQAAVKLKSEYVARVSDVGTADNGTPYMVMEFLEGHDLGELLKQRGTLPVQWAVDLMLQTAEALCEAHSLGIVHRDVKPTNLFVTWRPDGSSLIKVLDFGISKSPMGTDMHLTQTQSLLGTPAYMSPEQMRSARLVDHRTDIWSLGTVFYEVLEGRKPFEAESFSEMCVKVAVDPPTPMQNTPPPLQQVILRCLAKSHDQRYANMAEFARDLVPFAADPHAAQNLVERMLRMLKRSTFDWEGSSTGVGRQALPQTVKDVASGPVRSTPIPGWNPGSDPAGRPWHSHTPIPNAYGGESSGSYRPVRHQSQPIAPYPAGFDDSQTVAQPRKSGKIWLLILGLLLVTGGAVAFGVIKASEQTSTSASSSEVMPQTNSAETGSDSALKPDIAGSAASAPATNAGSDTPVKAAGSDAITAPTAPADDKQLDKTGKTDKASKTDKSDKSDKTSKTDKRSDAHKTVDKSSAKSTSTTKTDATSHNNDGRVLKAAGGGSGSAAPDVKAADPAVKPCDPFGSMHGCQK
jgi:serine/threonine protein kinase